MSKTTFDVIVIGAGIAGISTALAVKEQGLDVVLLEKMPTIGGSTVMSGGWFAFTGTEEQQVEGIEDSIELFREDLLNVGAHQNNPNLVDAYLEHQLDTYRWLKNKGVNFGEVSISSGQSAARGHSTKIREVVELLHADFSERGGKTRLNARVTALSQDPSGRVDGVVIDGDENLYARCGVVIASGGFSRSTELLKIFAPEQLAALPYGGAGNTGDGLKMGWKLGDRKSVV